MPRWILPVALSALVAGVLAWLFATEQGARGRRQLTKQGQLVLEQGAQTFNQVSRQVQGGAQDLLNHGRQLVDTMTK